MFFFLKKNPQDLTETFFYPSFSAKQITLVIFQELGHSSHRVTLCPETTNPTSQQLASRGPQSSTQRRLLLPIHSGTYIITGPEKEGREAYISTMQMMGQQRRKRCTLYGVLWPIHEAGIGNQCLSPNWGIEIFHVIVFSLPLVPGPSSMGTLALP